MDKQVYRLKMGLAPNTVNVDVEGRKLSGVIAIEPIDIKDYRPFTINDEFITDLVAMANKEKGGVKSHFGHSWSTEGKLLGKATDWRIEDGKAKYDLSIYKSADDSPVMPGMGRYLLNQLSEDVNTFMTSIVFREKYFYQLGADGAHIKVYYYDSKGSWIKPVPDLGKVYPKLGALYSSDIVSEGAATNSMFSIEQAPQNESDMKSFFTKIANFFKSDDQAEDHIHSQNSNQMDNNTPAPAAPDTAPTVESLAAEIAALRKELAAKSEATPAPAPETAPTPDALTLAQQEIAQLKTQLAATPAAIPIALNTGAEGGEQFSKDEWYNDPINVEARQMFNNMPKSNKTTK